MTGTGQHVACHARAMQSLQLNSAMSVALRFMDGDLEKRFWPAGDGYQYHHIVEQGSNEGHFAALRLNSTSNVVRLPTIVHEEVSAVMGRKYKFSTGEMPLREFLRGASYEQQRAWGLWAMRQAGALK